MNLGEMSDAKLMQTFVDTRKELVRRCVSSGGIVKCCVGTVRVREGWPKGTLTENVIFLPARPKSSKKSEP